MTTATTDLKIKTAEGKVPLQLLPLWALFGLARVFAYGATKYAPGNWLLASDQAAIDRYIGALLRHVSEMQLDVQATDHESRLPHIDHAIASLVMLRGILIQHFDMEEDPTP